MQRVNNILSFVRKKASKGRAEPHVPRAVPILDEQRRLLVDQACQEMVNVGLHIALTASALNHLDRELNWRAVREHFIFEPSEAIVAGAAVDMLSTERYMPELELHFDLMAVRLLQARRLLRGIRERADIPNFRDRDALVCSWSITADAALLALADFERAEENLLHDHVRGVATVDRYQDVRTALVAARDGETPLLVDGLPRLPDWAERRRSRRIPLNMGGSLCHRGACRAVHVRDVSAGGMGIEYCGSLPAGEIVVLVLESGRRFIAKVAWSHSDRAGLTLASALAPCDPMISGA